MQLSQNEPKTPSKVEACSSVYESVHRGTELRDTELRPKATRRETSLTGTERRRLCRCLLPVTMVKEEEIVAEAGGRGYMDLLGLGEEEDYLTCLSPSSYFSSSVVSTATTTSVAPAATSSPTCASYLDLAPAYHQMLSFAGQGQYHGGDGVFGLRYYGGDQVIPVGVLIPQKSSPTTECSSSVSSMSSSPPATTVSAISSPKTQAFKKKGSRSSDQRKAAPAAVATTAAATNKRPRVRREKLGERIIALQQLVSPFGKSDTASVLHEALGYIRFLHDQVQVLSSPYMQQLPVSAHAPAPPESAAGTVVEPPRATSNLRSRGLCLVPIACTEHVAGGVHGQGHGNGADLWSVAAGMAKAAAENKGAAAAAAGALLPGGGHGHLGHLA